MAARTVALAALLLAGCKTTADHSAVLDVAADPLEHGVAELTLKTVPSSGDFLCFGADALWEPSGGKLSRLDPATAAVTATIPVSVNWCAAAPGSTTLWAVSVAGKVYKIEATTNTLAATYDVPVASDSEGSFAVTGDGVWILTGNNHTLTRLDPATGKTLATITVANDSHGVAAANGSVWVTSASGNSVTQVDAKTNTVTRTIAVDAGPRFIAAGGGGVWTQNQVTGTVSHIDPATGRVVATIDYQAPGGGGDIAVGEGYVWVATFDPPLIQIDPKTDRIVAKYALRGAKGWGDAVRTGGGSVWVSGRELHQIAPPNPLSPRN